MIEWLTNYGVKRASWDPQDLDVYDKLHLQDQINAVRRQWVELLQCLDSTQERLLQINLEMSQLVRDMNEKATVDGVRVNSLLSVSDDYIKLEAQQKALQVAIGMINSQLDLCKSDIRILNSAMYGKF